VKILETLNEMGGRHGVGQVDLVENRLVGMKSRGVYETPGGTIIMNAHEALETLTLDRETYHYKKQIALKYAQVVYNGQWFCPVREALDAFIDSTQKVVNGVARVKLYKGRAVVVGIKSPNSLYSNELASFEMGAEYEPTDAIGFIRLYGLPMKVNGIVNNPKPVKKPAKKSKPKKAAKAAAGKKTARKAKAAKTQSQPAEPIVPAPEDVSEKTSE
jgi:argininosuccinate synthase